MRRLPFALVLVALFASAAGAFDGDRRGFVLAFGLGYSPHAEHGQDHHDLTFTEESSGFAGALGLGWGWNDRNVLMFEGNATSTNSSLFGDRHVNQGFAGFSWYHYFADPGNSVFTVVGVGTYAFGVEDDYEQLAATWSDDLRDYEYDAATPRRRGPGLLAGAGYEFADHWQAGVFVSGGRTKAYDVDVDHFQVSVLVQWVAF